MPKLNDVVVPDCLLEELKSMVANAESRLLMAYAQTNKYLCRGFQLKMKNIGVIRKKFSELLCRKNTNLSKAKMCVIEDAGFNREFIRVLSLEAIEHGLNEFMIVFGQPKVIWGLLTDQRDVVRELGMNLLKEANELNITEPTEEDIHNAQEILKANFALFFDAIHEKVLPMQGYSSDEITKDNQAKVIRELECKLSQSEERNEKSRKLKNTIKALESKVSTLSCEMKEMESRYSNEKLRREQANLSYSQVSEELDKLKTTFNDQVQTAVDNQLSERVRPWFASAEELKSYSDSKYSDQTLDDKVQRALGIQAKRDLKYGTISALNERFKELEAMLEQLNSARQNALQPLPELAMLADSVANEIRDIKNKLGDEDPFNEKTHSELVRQINSTDDPEKLQEHQLFAHLLVEKGLLGSSQKKELDLYVRSKMTYTFDSLMDRPVREDAEGQLFVLDGHNILHKLPHLFDMSDEPAARKKLVDTVVNAFSNSDDAEVLIFFDGPTRSEINHGALVREIYSGGGDKSQRADTAIIHYVNYLREYSHDQRELLLVTEDNALGREVERYGAEVMHPELFGAKLVS